MFPLTQARPAQPTLVQHARAVYVRVLRRTLGTHLDDAALDDLAADMTKLRDAIT